MHTTAEDVFEASRAITMSTSNRGKLNDTWGRAKRLRIMLKFSFCLFYVLKVNDFGLDALLGGRCAVALVHVGEMG